MAAQGPSVIPVYGFLEGDTMGILLLAKPTETMAGLVALIQQSASVRVAPRENMAVVFGGRRLSPKLKVGASGIGPLDRIDVVHFPDGGGDEP